ncbi:MAG: DUF3943 domain-containing protein [Candidatus Thiodiazotropha sp.]
MKDEHQLTSRSPGRLSVYLPIVLLLSSLLSGVCQADEWLPLGHLAVSEPESQRYLSGYDISRAYRMALTTDLELDTTTPPAAERPYGFGRELDDDSPADYDGLKRDAAYFFGYQFFIVGILYVLPEEISAWSDEQKSDYKVSKWWDNVTNHRWDPDLWYINYVLHPYWGMTYYTRGRERGLDETGAFWFSFTLSAIYEFGLEALFEPVSIQDLIFTPGLGSLLGWYLEDTRREIKSQRSFGFWDKTFLIVTDPLGTLNTMVDSLIDTESELELRTFYQSPDFSHVQGWDGLDSDLAHSDPLVGDYLGLQLTIRW